MVKTPKGQPLFVEANVCRNITGKLIFATNDDTPNVKFNYQPMKYFKERKTDFTACLKDGDLVLTVENAIKSCLSEKGIQLLEPQIPLKLGRNNITGKNVKEKTNLKITPVLKWL